MRLSGHTTQRFEAARHHRKRFVRLCLAALAIVLLGSAAQSADVIDRLLAVVGGQVVTLSDLEQHRALGRLFGDPVPEDDESALREVIENLLIRNEIFTFPGIQITPDELDAYLSQLRNMEELPLETVRTAVGDRLQLIRFVDLRFRQFIQATDEEIGRYYDDVFVPEARAQGLEPVPLLDDVLDLIRTNVIEEKVSEEITVWTEALYRRSEIEVVE